MDRITMSNKLTIIRGLPGSGKSTLGRRLAAESGAIFVEPDMFLMHGGEYRYTANRYEEAVRKALFFIRKAECDVVYADVLPKRMDVVKVMDAFYFCEYDKARKGECRIIALNTSLEESIQKNVHNVNVNDIRRMWESWEICLGEERIAASEYLFYEFQSPCGCDNNITSNK